MEPLNVSIAEAAKLLGVGRTSIYRAISLGELRTIRILGRHLVPVAAIKTYQSKVA